MNRPVERPVPAAGPVDFDRYIDDRIDEGQFAVHRDIFRDEFLFELEMKYIFESNWVFLCHASQLPKPHDFFSTHIGRQPVLVTRNAAGELKAFLNTCTHKGSLVCLNRSGNRKFHSCTYHGWTFDTNGRCVSIKDHAEAAYTPAFEAHSHDLHAVPKLAEYRGWIFGSLNADVVPLEQHLGDARVFIDLLVEQAPDGMELVRGNASYTFPGNWKLQVENCLDGYHLNIAHKGFIEITRRRIARAGAAYKGPDIEAMFGVNLKTGQLWPQERPCAVLHRKPGAGVPAAVAAARAARRASGGRPGQVAAAVRPQPDPLPERAVHRQRRDRPVPRAASAGHGSHRNGDLLRVPVGASRRAPPAAAPVRGFLQHQFHRHAGRRGRLPQLPGRPAGARGRVVAGPRPGAADTWSRGATTTRANWA